jgi:hypothetical protein
MTAERAVRTGRPVAMGRTRTACPLHADGKCRLVLAAARTGR